MAADPPSSVLMTADTVAGVWTYAVELARALSQDGMRIHLATMGGPVRDAQRLQLEGIAGLTLHESEYALEWMREPWDDLRRAGDWLLRLEDDLKPDVVHLNQFAFGRLATRAPKLLVAHSCVLSWWRAVHGEAAPAEWDNYRRCVAEGLRGADLVAAPTQAMLATLSQNHGYDGPQLVLPNARDPLLFRPGAKQDIIFTAGRFWDEAKNLTALDDVAELLPWPVRAAGSCVGPHGGLLRPKWVHSLGEVPATRIAQEMRNAAIYALPARYEPFGLSVLEAALSGCALVLGDIPSLRETWGAAAVYVSPDDHPALHGALQRLIAEPHERSRLAKAALERALHFHPRRMARAYRQAYAALASGHHSISLEETTCA